MPKIRVVIIESERGWGQRVDEEREFDTIEEAEAFCADYNKDNTLPVAPDWYMYARIVNPPIDIAKVETDGQIH